MILSFHVVMILISLLCLHAIPFLVTIVHIATQLDSQITVFL